MEYQLKLAEKNRLIEPLKEIAMQEDTDFLSEEFKEILQNSKQIQNEIKMQPRKLEFLHGIV